jgi:formamidopyrimidine-DNA glycosylase
MPELPDLEVFSKNLNKLVKGKTVVKLIVKNGKRIKFNATSVNKVLAAKKLTKIYREGKQLFFVFGKDIILAIHLMLHGKLLITDKDSTEKYTIAALLFKDDTQLVLTDFQGMAQLSFNPGKNDVPDALSKTITAAFLKKIFSVSGKQVKEVLMDQHIIRGIGNAYADEILWEARVSPFSVANKIPATVITQLAKAIKKTLTAAQKNILKAEPGIISGEVRDFMVVHNAKKDKTPTGKPIKKTTIKSRPTYYTAEQELYK